MAKDTSGASRTCEVWSGRGPETACGRTAVEKYPAMGGGWMSLCAEHAQKHKGYTVGIDECQTASEARTLLSS